MKYRMSYPLVMRANCRIDLIPPSKNITVYLYHNQLAAIYLAEMAKLISGESLEYDMSLKIVELCSESAPVARKQYADAWRIGVANTHVFSFARSEANAALRYIRFYAGDATTAFGTGMIMSEIAVNFSKTGDYIMNIVYSTGIQNA